MRRPRAEASMSFSSRLSRVTSCLALITPPAHHLAVSGRLGVKELPCRLVLPEQAFVGILKLGAPLFVGVDAGLVFSPRLKGLQAGGLHASLLGQHPHAPDIDGAPDANRLAWGETNGVAAVVHAFADPINPADTEGFIHRFGPSNARLAG